MTIYHKHHIVPRHAGGTDDPSNIIELTVEEHAEAHRKLWEEHGRIEDKLAWQSLSGMIGKEEVIRHLISEHSRRSAYKNHALRKIGMYGKNQSDYQRKRVSETQKGRRRSEESERKRIEAMRRRFNDPNYVHPNKGRKLTPEQRAKLLANLPDMSGENNGMYGKTQSIETRNKIAETAKNRIKKTCPHCSKISDVSNYSRWHGDNCRKIRS